MYKEHKINVKINRYTVTVPLICIFKHSMTQKEYFTLTEIIPYTHTLYYYNKNVCQILKTLDQLER